jgi:hypothetical protein
MFPAAAHMANRPKGVVQLFHQSITPEGSPDEKSAVSAFEKKK